MTNVDRAHFFSVLIKKKCELFVIDEENIGRTTNGYKAKLGMQILPIFIHGLKSISYLDVQAKSEMSPTCFFQFHFQNDILVCLLKVQIPSPKIDIFIIYAKDDKELMIHICQMFKRIKETFKISSLYEITQREDTWQHDVQQEMVMSKR